VPDTEDKKPWCSPEEAILKLEVLQGAGDWEWAHCEADRILCGVLNYYGNQDVVKAWDEVGKWYA
jgi:hypothetical protein